MKLGKREEELPVFLSPSALLPGQSEVSKMHYTWTSFLGCREEWRKGLVWRVGGIDQNDIVGALIKDNQRVTNKVLSEKQ